MNQKTKQSGIVVGVILCICLLVYFVFPMRNCILEEDFDKRAVWLTYQDLSNMSYDSKESFTNDFKEVISHSQNIKCNTLIVQVRPFSDALYQSKLFPNSQVITQKNSLSFDPLDIMIDLAHQSHLSIEAWINPYRISLNQKSYNQFLTSSKYSSWLEDEGKTIYYGQYQYIFNPQSKEVRDYIVDGVEEVVNNYDIDGIHFDDYFYVSGTHSGTTQDERMENVSLLIQDVYQSIKSIDDSVTFGISPQGNYENCLSQGADVDTWLKEKGFIDYLMPQIYWSDQYYQDGQTTMFSDRAKLFSQLKRDSDIKLYAGLALYQSGQELDYDPGWSLTSDNLSSQVQTLFELGYDGYSLFRYDFVSSEEGQLELDNMIKTH